jgi:hypothetical protein
MQGSHEQATNAEETPASMNRKLRHKWRRRLFWFWVGGCALVGLFLVLAGPLAPFTGLEHRHVAIVVPPFMALLLVSGLVWLVLLVRSRRR